MKTIDIIAGARPNFVKIAPIIHAIIKFNSHSDYKINYRLIHTGQHYDKNMSGNFFEQLEIPEPHVNLNSGGGTQAEQTASIMIGFERDLLEFPADLVLVVGDVTSTMACAITAQKLCIPVAHVEGGIRSNDWSMPEEINRLVTDAITNYFFTTTPEAGDNLVKSGIDRDKIHFVGNTMIDTLLAQRANFIEPAIYSQLNLRQGNYIVMTLHRPANVDQSNKLKKTIDEIVNNSHGIPIVFPVHPRTKKILNDLGIEYDNLYYTEPLSYLEFNYLVEKAKLVVTDSGGITEETTVMHVPCITLRDNTERPETITLGTNELIGTNPNAIAPAMKKLFSGKWKEGSIPEKWDGKTSERIISILVDLIH